MTAGTVVIRNQLILSQSKIRREMADSTISLDCPDMVSFPDFQLGENQEKTFTGIKSFFWMVTSKTVQVDLHKLDNSLMQIMVSNGLLLTSEFDYIMVTNLDSKIAYIKAGFS